jgi:protoporphyrinogen oxidase
LTHSIVVIGAGPAGLTAAWELQSAGISDVTVIEAESQVGGISRTVNYRGNRIDIGGHRFFSKSDWVMNWWTYFLPLEDGGASEPLNLQYRGSSRNALPYGNRASPLSDAVMLVRSRLSRIYFNQRFFDYPLKLNVDTLRKLGLFKTVTFGLSYVVSRARPIRPERTLEDFLVNRFGDRLYRQFFKEYTEKVWGVACSEIGAEWGAQRIKSLSITKAVAHALRSALGIGAREAKQTSLIESFIYPKYGPGQMWETVADRFVARGGKLLLNCKVDSFAIVKGKVNSVGFRVGGGSRREQACTHVVSTMPVKDLVLASREAWSEDVLKVAAELEYRDFITVGLLYRHSDFPRRLEDNWIYIQEPGVQVGRVQVFNNWSPYMVADPQTVWMGLEYFCKERDPLWSMGDDEMKTLAQREMKGIGLVSVPVSLDAVVIRVPKAYPGYFGEAYRNFDRIRAETDAIENLFLVGRNGMHRYNNQDHSMLTAHEAAMQIVSGVVDKAKIWNINVGDEYHEERRNASS